MNKLSWLLLLPLLILIGCDKDDDDNNDPPGEPEPLEWSAASLWDSGSNPVVSPDGTRILFLQEGLSGGLYLLENDAARKLNADGPAVRSDYRWSADGTRIAFSAPGLPGESNSGVFISASNDLTEFEQLWNRGSSPVFTDQDQSLFCAGPEGTDEEGIWKINLISGERTRIIPQGVSPVISPDETRLAYLFTTGGSEGRTLVVFHRQFFTYDTLGTNAAGMTWLYDSRHIVYESVRDSVGFPIPTSLYKLDIEDGILPGERLFQGGSNPSALPGGEQVAYSALGGDEALGIWLTDLSGNRTQISDSGVTPFAVASNRIVASGPTGIFELIGE